MNIFTCYSYLCAPIVTIALLFFPHLKALPLGYPPLIHAIADNKPKLVRLLLHYQADPNVRSIKDISALAHAIRYDHYDIVHILLQCKTLEIDAADDKDATPLMYAIHSNKPLHVMQSLIERGANIEAKNRRQQTPLMKAVICGQVEMVEELVRHGADVHAKDHNGNTAVAWAAFYEKPTTNKMILFLCQHGASMIIKTVTDREFSLYSLAMEEYMKPFNVLAQKRSAIIERVLYDRKGMPRVIARLIREFENPAQALSNVVIQDSISAKGTP